MCNTKRNPTCTVPDIPGLQANGSAAQCEAVGPLSTATSSGFKQLFWVVVPETIINHHGLHMDVIKMTKWFTVSAAYMT